MRGGVAAGSRPAPDEHFGGLYVPLDGRGPGDPHHEHDRVARRAGVPPPLRATPAKVLVGLVRVAVELELRFAVVRTSDDAMESAARVTQQIMSLEGPFEGAEDQLLAGEVRLDRADPRYAVPLQRREQCEPSFYQTQPPELVQLWGKELECPPADGFPFAAPHKSSIGTRRFVGKRRRGVSGRWWRHLAGASRDTVSGARASP